MKLTKRGLSATYGLFVLAAIAVLLFNRQGVIDWWRLRNYQPSDVIVQLADQTTMSEEGRHTFYTGRPELNDKLNFGDNCKIAEQSIVLGCYTGFQRIYVLKVNDPRLNGVQQVTAAHEMLHAAYDRMSQKQKDHINTMVNAAYANIKDERLAKTIDQYRVTEPNDIPNELHSILGTEVRNLPAQLETYYKQYFTNRLQIVSYSESYEQAFVSRETQIKSLSTQLTALKAQLEALQKQIESERSQLESRRANLESLERRGQIEGYNAAVPGFNGAVSTFNADIRKYKTLADQYNALVVQHNDLVSQEQELIQAVDAKALTPEPAQ